MEKRWLLLIIVFSLSLVFAQTNNQNVCGLLGLNENCNAVVNNGEVVIEEGFGVDSNSVVINKDNGYFEYTENGRKIKFDNLKQGSTIVFQNGELKQFVIFTNDKSEYEVKNLEFQALKNSEVIFKDDKITVIVPSGGVITENPSLVYGNKPEVEIEYIVKKTDKNAENGISIPIGKESFVIKGAVDNDGKLNDLKLGFDADKGLYAKEGTINGMEFGAYDGSDDRVYFFDDGEMHKDFDSPYFSLNDKKVSFGVPERHQGMYVNFNKGNEIVEVKDGQRLSIVALGKLMGEIGDLKPYKC